MELTATGNIFTAFSSDSKRLLFNEIAKQLSESAQRAIITDFDRSVRLAALVGERADQEALRAIYRSLKVEIKNMDPLELEAKFEDDYSHWYDGEELPQDMADTLQEIIDSSIKEWLNTPEPGEIIMKVLVE